MSNKMLMECLEQTLRNETNLGAKITYHLCNINNSNGFGDKLPLEKLVYNTLHDIKEIKGYKYGMFYFDVEYDEKMVLISELNRLGYEVNMCLYPFNFRDKQHNYLIGLKYKKNKLVE